MTERESFDIVIVGAGMVGATLACALGQARRRIAVVEAGEAKVFDWREDYDVRVSAISPASQAIFSVLGVWEGVVKRRVSPFVRMCVWDAAGGGEISFDSAELGEAVLGHIIENRVIQAALLDRLTRMENVELVFGSHPNALEAGSRKAALRLDDGRILESALIVGADGLASAVRRLAGLPVVSHDYQQRAIVCTVRPQHFHEATAWQRFLPEGPLAFLPLASGHCSIVWSTSVEAGEMLSALPEKAFKTYLAVAFDRRLGEIETIGPRACFPLKRQYAPQYVRPRVALVGDAAHIIHPLAGQGANLGLMDAAALAETLVAARRHDMGSLRVLRQYERWRKGQNQLMMSAMDAFDWLFTHSSAPVSWARNVGLTLTNLARPVKYRLMLHAMGREGDLPRLARGLELI